MEQLLSRTGTNNQRAAQSYKKKRQNTRSTQSECKDTTLQHRVAAGIVDLRHAGDRCEAVLDTIRRRADCVEILAVSGSAVHC